MKVYIGHLMLLLFSLGWFWFAVRMCGWRMVLKVVAITVAVVWWIGIAVWLIKG